MLFHPTYGTFSTAGADGTISFWDKDSKQRLKTLFKANGTIACSAFNNTGNIFAYAVSYDWTKVYKKVRRKILNTCLNHYYVKIGL
jgi:mRNA export factor